MPTLKADTVHGNLHAPHFQFQGATLALPDATTPTPSPRGVIHSINHVVGRLVTCPQCEPTADKHDTRETSVDIQIRNTHLRGDTRGFWTGIICQPDHSKNVTLGCRLSTMEAAKRVSDFGPVSILFIFSKNIAASLALVHGIFGIVKVRPFRRYFSRGAKKRWFE